MNLLFSSNSYNHMLFMNRFCLKIQYLVFATKQEALLKLLLEKCETFSLDKHIYWMKPFLNFGSSINHAVVFFGISPIPSLRSLLLYKLIWLTPPLQPSTGFMVVPFKLLEDFYLRCIPLKSDYKS